MFSILCCFVGAILLVTIIAGVCLCRRCNKPSQPGIVLQQPAQGAAQPQYPKPTAPPQILNPPRIPHLNRGQMQDVLSQGLDIVTSPQGLDFTSLEGLDFTGMGELNLDFAM